jgi:hypothetical protein
MASMMVPAIFRAIVIVLLLFEPLSAPFRWRHPLRPAGKFTRGASGRVLKARHGFLDRDVALASSAATASSAARMAAAGCNGSPATSLAMWARNRDRMRRPWGVFRGALAVSHRRPRLLESVMAISQEFRH